MVSRRHRYHVVGFIDLIEKPPGSDSISPSFWLPVLELFNVGAIVWFHTELWIYIFAQLLFNSAFVGPNDLFEIFAKCFSLKDAILTQSMYPFSG